MMRYLLELEIEGATAMWTRPDSGDSPISYPAPTFSAVKGIFESILWGPGVLICPKMIEICRPIQYHSYATNYGGPLRASKSIKNGSSYQLYATVLVDVCYRFYAEAMLNPYKKNFPQKALEWDRRTTSPGHAYQEIFNRRLKRGQSYANLSLGWREFTPSYFGPFRENTKVFTELPDIPIPSMVREVFSKGYNSAYEAVYDTDLVIHEGKLVFPERR